MTDINIIKMYQATFKNMLDQVNRLLVKPARAEQPAGKYQWPLGDFTLEVGFSDDPADAIVPFTISHFESGRVCRGWFDVKALKISELDYPSPTNLAYLCLSITAMLQDVKEPTVDLVAHPYGVEPPMILTNMADINDEWIGWFRKDNPGTSYAKAVHAALARIDLEMKNYKKIIDKYAITRY